MEKRNKQISFKAMLITSLALIILGLAGLTVGVIIKNGIIGFVSGIILFTGIIVLIISVISEKTRKIVEEKAADPSTLYHRTYVRNDLYKYFVAIPNRQAQNTGKAVTNTLGVIGILLGGGGVVTYGTNSYDVFVSQDEIYLNDKARNRRFKEEKFKHILRTDIKDIQITPVRNHVRVVIITDLKKKKWVLDVPSKTPEQADEITVAFQGLLL